MIVGAMPILGECNSLEWTQECIGMLSVSNLSPMAQCPVYKKI